MIMIPAVLDIEMASFSGPVNYTPKIWLGARLRDKVEQGRRLPIEFGAALKIATLEVRANEAALLIHELGAAGRTEIPPVFLLFQVHLRLIHNPALIPSRLLTPNHLSRASWLEYLTMTLSMVEGSWP